MAEGIVAQLEVSLAVLKPKLEKATIEINELMEVVAADSAIAEEEKAKVAVDKEAALKISNEAGAIAKEAEDKLAVALPALEKAMKSVREIEEKDLNELKNMGKPPLKVV